MKLLNQTHRPGSTRETILTHVNIWTVRAAIFIVQSDLFLFISLSLYGDSVKKNNVSLQKVLYIKLTHVFSQQDSNSSSSQDILKLSVKDRNIKTILSGELFQQSDLDFMKLSVTAKLTSFTSISSLAFSIKTYDQLNSGHVTNLSWCHVCLCWITVLL